MEKKNTKRAEEYLFSCWTLEEVEPPLREGLLRRGKVGRTGQQRRGEERKKVRKDKHRQTKTYFYSNLKMNHMVSLSYNTLYYSPHS